MFCFELIKVVIIVRAPGAHKQPLRAAENCRRVAALGLATMPRTTAALFLFFPPRLITAAASPNSSCGGRTAHLGVGAALMSEQNPGALYSRSGLPFTGLTRKIGRRPGQKKPAVYIADGPL